MASITIFISKQHIHYLSCVSAQGPSLDSTALNNITQVEETYRKTLFLNNQICVYISSTFCTIVEIALPICNILLRLWRICLIPTYRVYRLYGRRICLIPTYRVYRLYGRRICLIPTYRVYRLYGRRICLVPTYRVYRLYGRRICLIPTYRVYRLYGRRICLIPTYRVYIPALW